MFWRTFRIAFFVTLLAALFGAPEAYILNRMKSPWRGLFLLVILGPLLISVVARTLGLGAAVRRQLAAWSTRR